MKTVRCKNCDCVLFSEHYRALQICPECVSDDEEPLDLEDRLDEALKNDTL